jgi:hypothetical protein
VKRHLTAVSALVLAVALAACAGSGTVSDPRLDPVITGAGITAGELPGGSSEPYADAVASALSTCAGRTPRASGQAQVTSALFRVTSDIGVYRSESEARSVISWYSDSKHIARCVADHRRPLLVDAYREDGHDASAVTFADTMMIRHPSPDIGDRSVSIRITIPIRATGRDAFDYTDVVVARRDNVIVLVVGVPLSGGETWDTRFAIEALARAIVTRLAP